jgi:hypothetical protein
MHTAPLYSSLPHLTFPPTPSTPADPLFCRLPFANPQLDTRKGKRTSGASTHTDSPTPSRTKQKKSLTPVRGPASKGGKVLQGLDRSPSRPMHGCQSTSGEDRCPECPYDNLRQSVSVLTDSPVTPHCPYDNLRQSVCCPLLLTPAVYTALATLATCMHLLFRECIAGTTDPTVVLNLLALTPSPSFSSSSFTHALCWTNQQRPIKQGSACVHSAASARMKDGA